MEKIKVKITSDGKAKEINSFGDFVKEQPLNHADNCNCNICDKIFNDWSDFQNKLRTFDIEGNYLPRYKKHNDGFFSFYTHKVVMINSIHTAKIIDTDKLIVRIL